MPTASRTPLIATVAGIAIVVVIVLGMSLGWFSRVSTPSSNTTPTPASPTVSTSVNEPTNTLPTTTTAGTDRDTGQANVTYQESQLLTAYHFQFDNTCHATAGLPLQGSLNVKQNSLVVLENHGTSAHRLALGNTAYEVAAGGFTVASAPAVSTTTGLLVTCDGKGAGRLYVYP